MKSWLRRATSSSLGVATAMTVALGLLTACDTGERALPQYEGDGRPGTVVDGRLRLNQLQVVGTHNSYHLEATARESRVRGLVDADGERALQFAFPSLEKQFSQDQVRQIELDLWADPKGGLYADPLLRKLTFGGKLDPAMKKPGTKVLHIQDLDYHSNCLTFISCLQGVKRWSDANPDHTPLAILIEFKDTLIPVDDADEKALRDYGKKAADREESTPAAGQRTGRALAAAVGAAVLARPVPWDTAQMDTVDADIRSVFDADELMTPDDVRGSDQTLEQAVLTRGWPTLAQAQGKIMFLMDNAGSYRNSYLTGHAGLRGRILFTNSKPGDPDAAFIEHNDPTGKNLALIQEQVRRGYLVRTRADIDTVQARIGDTSLRDTAFASGAQWVSTDFPEPKAAARFKSQYVVQLADRASARCNPITPAHVEGTCIPVPIP